MSSTASAQRIGVIVVAGGSGQRLGYGVPKAQVPVAGVPMLARALAGVLESGIASAVAVAVPAGDTVLREVCAEAGFDVPVAVVDGGATRSESVNAALAALPQDLDAVLVHDAARALTPPQVFKRVAAALAAGAAAVIPAVPVVDTVKQAAPAAAPSPNDQGAHSSAGAGSPAPDRLERVAATPDRSRLRAVQTPQGFDAALLRRAHAGVGPDPQAATDDAMLVEALGAAVHLVPGAEESLKITTPLDLLLAEALLARGLPTAGSQSGPKPSTPDQES